MFLRAPCATHMLPHVPHTPHVQSPSRARPAAAPQRTSVSCGLLNIAELRSSVALNDHIKRGKGAREHHGGLQREYRGGSPRPWLRPWLQPRGSARCIACHTRLGHPQLSPIGPCTRPDTRAHFPPVPHSTPAATAGVSIACATNNHATSRCHSLPATNHPPTHPVGPTPRHHHTHARTCSRHARPSGGQQAAGGGPVGADAAD